MAIVGVFAGGLLLWPFAVGGQEVPQEWELMNPEGVVEIQPIKLATRLTTLEGKTVALRWNGKQNGNHFLDRLAELLTERVNGVKIIKIYELEPWTNVTAGPPYMSPEDAKKIAAKIGSYKPELVIAAQAD